MYCDSCFDSALRCECELGVHIFEDKAHVHGIVNTDLLAAGVRQIAQIVADARGVTMKVYSILMAILIGLGGGAQPILGYNYGAGKYDRVKTTFRYTMTLSVAVMAVALVLFQLFPRAIVSIFGTDSELYTQFSVLCLRIFLMAIPLGAEAARDRIDDVDRRRAEYYGELDGKIWGQADNYDICINVSATGEAGALFMIRQAVEGKLIQMKLTAEKSE